MQTVLEPSRSLSVFRQIGSHEIERRSRQGSVQSSERPLEGSQFRGGTIQRSEFGIQRPEGGLWRRRGKRVRSESRVQSSTCLPVGLRGVEKGVNPEFRVQGGHLGLRRRKSGWGSSLSDFPEEGLRELMNPEFRGVSVQLESGELQHSAGFESLAPSPAARPPLPATPAP